MSEAVPILTALSSTTMMHEVTGYTVHEFYAMIKAQLEADEKAKFEASWPTVGTYHPANNS